MNSFDVNEMATVAHGLAALSAGFLLAEASGKFSEKACAGMDRDMRFLDTAVRFIREMLPRVLTGKEVLQLREGWLEERGAGKHRCRRVIIDRVKEPEDDEDWTHVYYLARANDLGDVLALEDYGEVWRLWNERPTMELVAETPWYVERPGWLSEEWKTWEIEIED